MNTDRLLQLMRAPETMSPKDTDALYDIIRMNPGFQTAHLLLLYNLYRNDSAKFDTQLRESAIYIGDRKILFNLIHNMASSPASVTDNSPQSVQVEKVKTPEESSQELLDFDETTASFDPMAHVIEFDATAINSNETALEGNEEMMEFAEDVIGEPELENNADTNLTKNNLIDQFIDSNPVFTPNRIDLSAEHEDISEQSIKEPEELATETLALIYTSQKLFEKAIGVYEKLILKYPEKSTYFASRISDLRKNIN